MDDLEVQFKERMKGWLPPAGPVIAGVSGGADSMALLHLLSEALSAAGRALVVVHVHHGLRGAAADRDQQLVVEQCRKRGVVCTVFQREVESEARKSKTSLEEAGRMARHECFLEAAGNFRARVVALAHHQDDQAETVLLNLCRGAGGRGLGALRETRAFPHPDAPSGLRLVRPLLAFSKKELEAYLRRHRLRWRQDLSNQDPRFLRNRIRRRVLPVMERNMDAGITLRLARSGAALARDDDFLGELAEQRLRKLLRTRPEPGLSLNAPGLRRLPESLGWRVLALAWEWLHIPGKSFDHLQNLVDQTGLEHSRRLALPGRWSFVSGRDILRFVPPLISPASREESYRMELSELQRRGFRSVPPGSNYCLLDPGKIKDSLRLRTRLPGDTLRPLGLSGKSKTVKKIMSEMKIPEAQRKNWPLVAAGKEILWIFQGPVSEAVKVEPGSRKILKISLVKT